MEQKLDSLESGCWAFSILFSLLLYIFNHFYNNKKKSICGVGVFKGLSASLPSRVVDKPITSENQLPAPPTLLPTLVSPQLLVAFNS